VHSVRVPAVPPELRRRSISPSADRRRHPAAANTRHPNGGAASVADGTAKVFGRRRGGRVLVTAQRRRIDFRPPFAPPSAAIVTVPVAPSATATGHANGNRWTTTAAAAAAAAATVVQNDAAAATEGGQGATDPETDERVHGVGQGGTEKVGRRKSRFAQRRSQQNAR